MIPVDLTRLISAQDRAAEAEADRLAVAQAQARAYLTQTDWYVTRLTETGTPIPADVSTRREEARRILDPDSV